MNITPLSLVRQGFCGFNGWRQTFGKIMCSIVVMDKFILSVDLMFRNAFRVSSKI